MITTCKMLESGNLLYATVVTEKHPIEHVIVGYRANGDPVKRLALRACAKAECTYTQTPSPADKKAAEKRVNAALADAAWDGRVEFIHRKGDPR